MLLALPWSAFKDDITHFWVHYGLCILGFLLAVISFITQLAKPAPYGRHATQDTNWGPMVNQRIAHTLSDGPTGVIIFTLVFFLYGNQREYTNIVLLVMWICHYVHRGFIHPWIMNYSSATTPIGIPLAGLFPNLLYCYLNADWIGSARYSNKYYLDPRFIIGVILFVCGFVINRVADFKLKNLRSQAKKNDTPQSDQTPLDSETKGHYLIPQGCLFNLVSCPNYFGEMIEWFGWVMATWSAAGLVWFLFGCATFFPRAKQHHKWYKGTFTNYPSERRALIPFVY